jgi:hypothetical protein
MMARQQGYKAIVHYYLAKSCWSIHYNSCCNAAEYVIIEGPWQTEVKPLRPSNPRGWVTARSFQTTYFCSEDAKGPVVMELLNHLDSRVHITRRKHNASNTKGFGHWKPQNSSSQIDTHNENPFQHLCGF